ncbi:MAG: DNA cytosine methyltransferase, partial [bacterium]|nr:DNA cytosine methyltransferase [bacterium]
PFKLIDLFCGAGGMSLGFSGLSKQRFLPVWANDINSDCIETYNANFGDHCVLGNLVDLLGNPGTGVPAADVVVGGPPCQGFSLLNKKRENDPRNQLWRPFLEVVQRSGAKVFVIENVPQLLAGSELQGILETAEEMGFTVCYEKLCAADYGVAQTRNRAFIIGSKIGEPVDFFPPPKTHMDPKLTRAETPDKFIPKPGAGYVCRPLPWRTVRDAVGDLPPPVGTTFRDVAPPLDLHFGRNPTEKSVKRYKSIPEQGMNRFDLQRLAPELTPDCWLRKKTGSTDLFGRLWWDKPAVTMRTEFFKPEKGRYLHPVQHRPITFREAARFQGFPDSFIFKGSKTQVARQIGNAVPPPLAAALADVVYSILKGGRRKDEC